MMTGPVDIDLQKKVGYYSFEEEGVLAWVREHKSLSLECQKTIKRLDNSIIYHYALIEDYQAVRDLVAAGVSADIRSERKSALSSLVFLNHREGVRELLAVGANPNLLDHSGLNSLFNIKSDTHFEIIDGLVKAGADFFMPCMKNKTTALMHVCHILLDEELNIKILNLIAQTSSKVKLDFMDNNGNTALGLAILSGKFKVVKKLVEMGAALESIKERSVFQTNLRFNALNVAQRVLLSGVDKPPNDFQPGSLQGTVDYLKIHIQALREREELEEEIKKPGVNDIVEESDLKSKSNDISSCSNSDTKPQNKNNKI